MSLDAELTTKISGYLEKKGRLRIGSTWRKYWFVLEGRLLLYYRSKDEYETLSPCKGSINLSPPCNIRLSAGNYSFQIECRANPVTLRAENRSDQERWMQALLAAIARPTCPQNRMSHFRYSLDDLPVPLRENQNSFLRQNTMPHRNSNSINLNNEKVIDRLLHLGAHTYGGSLESIVKLSNEFQSKATKSNSSLHRLSKSSEYAECKINERDSDYYVLTNQLYSTDRNFYVENDQYSTIQEENSIDMLSYNDAAKKNNLERNVVRSRSLGIENEVLDLKDNQRLSTTNHLYEKLSSGVNLLEQSSDRANELYERLSDNSDDSQVEHEYSFIGRKKLSTILGDDFVSSPNSGLDRDSPKSALTDNENYAFTNVNTLDLTDSSTHYSVVDKTKNQETLYEDLDAVRESPINTLKSNYDTDGTDSPTSSNGAKKKNPLKKHLKKLSKLTKPRSLNETNKKSKLNIRPASFLRRVWRKKSKPVETEDDSIYESVDYSYSKKEVEGKNDIQMLEELQKILETRKNMLQEKLNENKTDGELKSATKSSKSEEGANEVSEKEWRPSLPPREHSMTSIKSITNNDESKRLDKNEGKSTKTIDEILKELDKDGKDWINTRNCEYETLEDCKREVDVVESVQEVNAESNKNSDQLSVLLEELAKVTCAPIMSPGQTSSLIIPETTNEEWLKLIPIRRRRSSEPDYDVPRPHTCLIIFEKCDTQKPMPVNKFLTPEMPNYDKSIESLSILSVEPDSLEVEHLLDGPGDKTELQLPQDDSINDELPNNTKHDTNVHSEPQEVLLGNDHQQHLNNLTLLQKDKSEETFIDSLELVSEVSTAF